MSTRAERKARKNVTRCRNCGEFGRHSIRDCHDETKENEMDELKTGYEWCDELGAKVVDPDGWRNAGKHMEDRITKEEFDKFVMQSTIDSSGYPSFMGGVTFISGL